MIIAIQQNTTQHKPEEIKIYQTYSWMPGKFYEPSSRNFTLNFSKLFAKKKRNIKRNSKLSLLKRSSYISGIYAKITDKKKQTSNKNVLNVSKKEE